MDNLYLIAGLGNPGREYAGTRHNIGFMLAEQLASRWRARVGAGEEVQCAPGAAGTGRETDHFVPAADVHERQRRGGGGVARILPPAASPQLLVVVDDADLPLGQIRLRAEGSSGGHHGLESVEAQLGTREYPRLRLGIGRREDDGRQISNYVLGRFAAAERAAVEEVLNRAGRQVECWLSAGMKRSNEPI